MRYLGWILLLAWTLAPAHSVSLLPRAALPYKAELQLQARRVFGPDAPVALLAAQIEAESSWRPRAISRSGDKGLAQIGRHARIYLSRIRPGPGPGDPHNARWSMSAMAWYDYHLRDAIQGTANDCEKWKMALASYNGGLGWLVKERKLCARAKACDPSKWSGHVERFSARSKWAYKENRTYIKRVLAFQKKYAAWGPMICQNP